MGKIEKNEDEKKDKMKNIKKNLENIKIEKITNDEKIKKDEIEIEEKKKLVQMKESVNAKKQKKEKKLQSDQSFANQSRALNAMRRRYVAQIKNICIAAPFDANQSLLAFKKEILSKIKNHAKLKKEKNLSKRIKFIKLKTPTFPMLIDCNPKDKLVEIATRKDIIVFHTESDDEEKEEAYFVDKFDD